MRIFFRVLCGIAAGLLASPVLAQEPISDSGLYITFGGGFSGGGLLEPDWSQETAFTDFEFLYSATGLGAIGYARSPVNSSADFRFELEGSYRLSQVNLVSITGVGSFAAEGYLETIAAMANGYIDFSIGPKVTPFLGLGIGGARVARRDISAAGLGTLSNKFAFTTGWQIMTGVGYRLSPGTIISLEVRHLQLGKFKFTNQIDDNDIGHNDILLTLRLVG